MFAQTEAVSVLFESAVWLGASIAALLLAGTIVSYLRRRAKASEVISEPLFALDELRRLRGDGRLSKEEFETLKRKVLSGP